MRPQSDETHFYTRRMRYKLWITLLAIGSLIAGSCSSETAAVVTVEDAFAATLAEAGEATTYRLVQFNGQDLSSSALGVDARTEIDLDTPTITTEISPEASHTVIDILALLGPNAAPGLSDVELEIWSSDERVVIDSTAYQAILDINPGAELGPFAPGIGFIDLTALEADGPDVVTAIAGTGPVDLATVAELLPAALDTLERDADDDRIFRGTTTYANFLTATGGDLEQVARGAAGGVALNLAVDAVTLGDIYIEFYEATPVEVEVETVDGLVSVISTITDLSDVYTFIFSEENARRIGIDPNEAASGRDAFADTSWTLETRLEFEADDDLAIEPAPETDDDRTDQWRAFIETSGLVEN